MARALQVGDTLELAIQIAEGLAKAHEAGIVHRDLKPENLMVSRDGYVKILDFGIAKLLPRRGRADPADSAQKTLIRVKTDSGTIMGTVNYMSPEQLLGGRVDLRCDVFSFGVVLCEMLTGICPFAADNHIDTMHAILHEEPRLRDALRSKLPPGLLGILTKALDRAPKQRYRTMKELAAELKTFKRDLELGQAATTLTKPRLVLKRITHVPRAAGIDYEKELNEAQFRAVTTTEGPLLVVAGAGTGKTRTLVYRVARLIESGARPESVLLLTFTRRAASGMLARAAGLADARCQRVSGGTFHSLGHGVMRRFPEAAGVSRNFTVLDPSDTEDLIDLLRRQLHLTRERRFPRKRTICSIFSMVVNKVSPLEEVLKASYPHFADEREALEGLYRSFEEFKRARHLLTYDDLLVRLREALEGSEELRRSLSEQYRYIMVDEYQDTNKLQAQIVRLLTATHDNVAVVGDECQSIFSFRGASHRNMMEFPELFPSAQVIKLEENFRSTQPILDVANAIISEAEEGFAKRLFSRVDDKAESPVLVSARDENEQSRFVAERIAELREEGVPHGEIAVLFRASSHSFDLEIELSQARHPVPQVRRHQVRRVGARQGCAGLSARGLEPVRHALVVPRAEAARPHRRRDGQPDTRPPRRRAKGVQGVALEGGTLQKAAPLPGARRLPGAVEPSGASAPESGREQVAGRAALGRAPLLPPHPEGALRRPPAARARPRTPTGHREALQIFGGAFGRRGARSLGRDTGGRPRARRRRRDALDRAFGEGLGVGRGLRDLDDGRLVPVVALLRRVRGFGGGAPAALRRRDARAAAPLLRPPAHRLPRRGRRLAPPRLAFPRTRPAHSPPARLALGGLTRRRLCRHGRDSRSISPSLN